MHTYQHLSVPKRVIALCALIGMLTPQLTWAAVSSWNPTLLVNTESFQSIDDGDGTTDIELRFGGTLNEKLLWNRTKESFQFTDDLSVLGTLSGSALQIDGNANVTGNITGSGTMSIEGAAYFGSTVNAVGDMTTQGRLSGATLRVSGDAEIDGALSVTGAMRTDDNLTINDDRTTGADATLTFGNQTANQTLKFVHATQQFQFSKDVSVVGNLSGSTLTVDGAITWGGQVLNAPGTQSAGTFLKTDGAGNLTWEAVTVGNGSGGILSLHPEYPNAVYFSSGASFIGQLSASGGTADMENYYHWATTKAGLQDYWISVRVRLPDNFGSWDPVKPIELRYRTADGTADNNHVTLRMKDTENAAVALTGNEGLANASFTTANITLSGGTWAPKGYITVYIKLAALATKFAEAGFLNLNFETTTP